MVELEAFVDLTRNDPPSILSALTHGLLVTRILVIKWVCQYANMTRILVTAAVGGSRPAGKQWYC